MQIIKIDLARTLGERMDITIKDADEFLTVFMDIVGEILEKGEKVQLAGFGGFDLRYVPEHQGRNPKTGEVLTIPACYYPTFKAGKGLKERVTKCTKPVDGAVGTETEKVKAKASAPSTKPTRKKKTSAPPEEPV